MGTNINYYVSIVNRYSKSIETNDCQNIKTTLFVSKTQTCLTRGLRYISYNNAVNLFEFEKINILIQWWRLSCLMQWQWSENVYFIVTVTANQ